MQDELCGQIIPGRELRLTGRLLIALRFHEPCALLPQLNAREGVDAVVDTWKVLILRDLMSGTKRFGELKKSIGHVTQKVLTAQLRQMETSGLLTRKVYAEVPPRVEYTLTDLGYSLKPILDAMWTWGEGYQKMMSPQPPEA